MFHENVFSPFECAPKERLFMVGELGI
uniref:Uncharacterized protein n=1 Tax=Rhizophora mucronata TaxID=61149 RepID=A0A2P2P8R4_RHIMU